MSHGQALRHHAERSDSALVKDMAKTLEHQASVISAQRAKILRQREWIQRLVDAEDHCVYRIEAALLREEVLACPHHGEVPPQVVSTETLSAHFLFQLECEHDPSLPSGGRDRVLCACSLVDLGWHPTVGDAVRSWIAHLQAQDAAKAGA